MEPQKRLKSFQGEGHRRLPNGQPIPTTLPPSDPNRQFASRVSGKKGKKRLTKLQLAAKKKTLRQAGAQSWVDESMEDWVENDFRLFIGDLGSEVSDDQLAGAFRRYSSLLKTKVVRDTKSGKSKGYGFASFGAEDDYIRAMREMNGKYVGARPISLRRSTWKKRAG